MKILTIAALGLITFIAGMTLEYKIMKKNHVVEQNKIETQIIQKDNSIILKSNPQTNLKPLTMVPKQDQIIHTGHIQLQEEITKIAVSNQKVNPEPITNLPNIPKIDLDYSIVKEPSGQERIIVKAPDGIAVSGDDYIEPTQPIETNKREIIGLYGYDFNTHRKHYGVMYRYQMLKHVSINTGYIGNIGFAGIGISF